MQNSLTLASSRRGLNQDAHKLAGVYCWLNKKQKRALKWWQRVKEAGEQLGARLELSRVYFEIGKRLLQAESNYDMLNGITAEEYLGKVKILFEEMDLPFLLP